MEKNQEVLGAFMRAWQAGDYEKMFDQSQLTWKEGKSEKHIETLFSDINLEDWKVVSSTTTSSVARKFSVEISLDIGGLKDRIVVAANVICESSPYKTATFGTWGVNPHSVTNVIQRIERKKPPKKVASKAKK
jgi:hypothetical protein